jgi:hypothetical protein
MGMELDGKRTPLHKPTNPLSNPNPPIVHPIQVPMMPNDLTREVNSEDTSLLCSDRVIKVDLVDRVDGHGVDTN